MVRTLMKDFLLVSVWWIPDFPDASPQKLNSTATQGRMAGNASLSFGLEGYLLSFGRILAVCTCNHVSIREKQGNQ
jgi:hypothetical protein